MINSPEFWYHRSTIGVKVEKENHESEKQVRLDKESAKLDILMERALAEEGFGADTAEWPEY